MSKDERSKSFKLECVYENWIGLNRFGQIQKQVLSSCLSLLKWKELYLFSLQWFRMNKNLHISFSLLLFKMYGWVYELTYVCLSQWMSEWNEWMNMILRTRLQIIQMNWRPIWKRFPIVVFNSLIVQKYKRFQLVSFWEKIYERFPFLM